MRLQATHGARQEEIKAFTADQAQAFLLAAEEATPRLAILFLTLARTGMRLGEALALQWDDIDLQRREIRLARAISTDRRVQTPKSGHGRTLDLSQQLVAGLRQLHLDRKIETLRCGWAEVPPWAFCSTNGTPYDHRAVEKAFKRVLRAADLPPHFTPHCLRHTYASLLLLQGESPVYVQRQLGHASIQITVDTYGRYRFRRRADPPQPCCPSAAIFKARPG